MNWGTILTVAGAIAFGAPSAHAQYISRGPEVIVASDIDAPYVAGPPFPPRYAPERYSNGPRYAPPPYAGEAYGPSEYAMPMLPPREIVGIARRNGFSPLSDPQQRGVVYRIAVISPDGDDGRLVIDARTGRIIRFLPASEFGQRLDRNRSYASAPALPPMADASLGSLRPPSTIPARPVPPKLAALPKPATLGAAPAPRRQVELRQAIPPAPPAALASVVTPPQQAVAPAPAAKPPTDMPPAQGLD